MKLSWIGYHVGLKVRGAEAILGVTTKGYGRVYGPPVVSDRETKDSGDGKEETDTEEADVCCSTLLLRASVSADSLLLFYLGPVVPYSGSSLSSLQRFNVYDGGTLISMDWFGAGRTSGGERWDLYILESRTKLRVVRGGSRGDVGNGDGVPILVEFV